MAVEITWHDAPKKRKKKPNNEKRHNTTETAPDDPLGQIRLRAMHVVLSAIKDPLTRAVITILFHKCEYVDTVLPIKHRHVQTRNECADEVASAFAAAIAAGQLPKETDPRKATMGLFSYIDGLVYNWLLDPDYFPLEADIEYYVDIY